MEGCRRHKFFPLLFASFPINFLSFLLRNRLPHAQRFAVTTPRTTTQVNKTMWTTTIHEGPPTGSREERTMRRLHSAYELAITLACTAVCCVLGLGL